MSLRNARMTDTKTHSMPEPPGDSPRRVSFNYFAWIGPLVTFVGAISYFVYFVYFPDLRDFPWVNLPLVGIGAILSIIGIHRAFQVPGYGVVSKAFASLGLAQPVGLAALFCFYIFSFSYQMPDANGVTEVSQPAPEFSLLDQNKQVVKLSDYRGKNLVITFYRGHW